VLNYIIIDYQQKLLIYMISLGRVRECSHEIIISVKEIVLVVSESHLVATILREKHGLAFLDGAGAEGAVVEGAAWSDGDDDTEVELFLLALGEEDAALGLGEGLGLLDEDAVHQRSQLLECDHMWW
jgi:hypothetical protein